MRSRTSYNPHRIRTCVLPWWYTDASYGRQLGATGSGELTSTIVLLAAADSDAFNNLAPGLHERWRGVCR